MGYGSRWGRCGGKKDHWQIWVLTSLLSWPTLASKIKSTTMEDKKCRMGKASSNLRCVSFVCVMHHPVEIFEEGNHIGKIGGNRRALIRISGERCEGWQGPVGARTKSVGDWARPSIDGAEQLTNSSSRRKLDSARS